MISRSGWFCLLLVVGCLSACGKAWAASEHRFPTPSLRALFVEEHARGVQRSETLARALLFTAKTAPAYERQNLARLAAEADPTLAEPHLVLARDATRRLDVPGVLEALGNAWNAARTDPGQKALWVQRIFHSSHTILVATLATLVILLAFRSVPLACHAVGERVGSQNVGALLVLVPLLCALALSPRLAALIVLPALALFLRRRERFCLAGLCLLLASMHLWLLRLDSHAVLAHPASRTAHVARLNAGQQDPEFEKYLLSLPQRSPDVDLLLGMQARRRGDALSAWEYFAAVVRTDSTSVAGYVNLSNVFFRAGRYERAAAGYRAAQTRDPGHPIPHTNLSATYVRMLEYAEADLELERAAERGFESRSWQDDLWYDEKDPLVDLPLSNTTLVRMAQEEAEAQPRLTSRLRQAWLSGGWKNLRTDVAVGWLLLVAALLLSKLRWRKGAVPCSACGNVVCASCIAREHLDERCDDCRPAKKRSRDPKVAVPRVESASSSHGWFTPFFPGAADLARGAVLRAAFGTMVGWMAILVALSAREDAMLRGMPWYSAADADQLRFAALAFLGAYLPGLIGFWQMRKAQIAHTRPAPRFGPPEASA